MIDDRPRFDEETWAQLPEFLGHLPEPVRLYIWGDERASPAEQEAAHLARELSERFPAIEQVLLPQRISFPHYPVIGVMGFDEDEAVDFGVRIIGLPAGYQMTSFIAAIQCVSFKGMTSEAQTRIHLHRLQDEITLELLTSAEDEAGTIMAQAIFNMAVISPMVRSYLIMADAYPEALLRYSVAHVPHLVINSRVHLEGVVDEKIILEHMAKAL